MNVPAELRYTSHDEWVRQDGGILVVGITDFAQDQLGDLVHVELPEVGQTFGQGEAVCEIESVKAVAEVYAPVAGTVLEVNEDLDGSEEQINEDPYGDGWLFKLSITGDTTLDHLLDSAAYEAKLAGN